MPHAPKNLALVVSRLNKGGTEVQVLELARALSTRDFKTTLFSFYSENLLWDEAKSIPGLNCVSIGKKSRWDLFFFVRLILALRQSKPEIVYSFLPAANLVSLLCRPFLPFTKFVWGIRASNMDFSHFDGFSKLVWKLECLLSRFVTSVVANSTAGKLHAVKNGVVERKVEVIPNGIDVERFSPDNEERLRMRKLLGVADCSLLVGIVGRFDPMKDHVTFLKAAKQIAVKRPNIKFVLVGVGESDGKLKEVFSEGALKDRLFFTGVVADPLSYYRAMDLFVSSSISEGFSNAIAEAMSVGIPCVVTDVGDSKIIVGETGWVVSPKNPGELAEGVLLQFSRMELAREEMQAAARARIVKNFSRETLGRRISSLFLQLTASQTLSEQKLTTPSPS